MNPRQRCRLINLNRGLIFALTFAGMLLDTLQIDDLLCTLALIVWLWMPVCTRLEARLLHWGDISHQSGPSNRSSASL